MSRRWMGITLPNLRISKRRGQYHVEDTGGESEGTSRDADQKISGPSGTLACFEPVNLSMPSKPIQQPMKQQPDDRRGTRVALTSAPAAVEAEGPQTYIQPRTEQQPDDSSQPRDLDSEFSRPPVEKAEPRFPDNGGIWHDLSGNIHGRPTNGPASILSNAQGTHIRQANIVAGTNVVFNHNSEDVARGKKTMLDNIASSALYNARNTFDPPQCDENTRVALLRAIKTWIKDRLATSARLQCITGSAGTWKSALMQTTARECETAGLVAATFFFSANDSVRNNLQSFIPTIAYQIALSNKSDPALGNCIFRAVDRDPSIFQRDIECQLEELIIKPLQETFPQGYVELFSSPSFPHLIAIDGLDECVDRKSQTKLLQIISTTFIDKGLPFKILLASRPERPLQAAILGDSGYVKNKSKVIDLDKHNPSVDIRKVFQNQLGKIGQESDDPSAQTNWPSPQDIETLVGAAAGLFAYASTVIKFVSQQHRWPCAQLATVIQVIKSSKATGRAVPVRKHPFAELDALYRSIFVFAQKEYATQCDDDDPLAVIRLARMFTLPLPCFNLAVVKSDRLVATSHPYRIDSRDESVADMEHIFQFKPGQLKFMFSDLHSLYTVKSDGSQGAVITPYHKSVQDFLLDPARCGDLYIPHYSVVGSWTTLALGILAEASDIMLTGSEEDCVATSNSDRVFWAETEMAYHVPLPSAIEDDAQWAAAVEEWHRIYKPFTDQGLFSRLARMMRGGALPRFDGRAFGLVLGFMLYEAPRLAGSEWDPSVRQDMQELFDAIKVKDLSSRKASEEKPFREGEPVSMKDSGLGLKEFLDQQPLGSIYPWPGETLGVNLRLIQHDRSEEADL